MSEQPAAATPAPSIAERHGLDRVTVYTLALQAVDAARAAVDARAADPAEAAAVRRGYWLDHVRDNWRGITPEAAGDIYDAVAGALVDA